MSRARCDQLKGDALVLRCHCKPRCCAVKRKCPLASRESAQDYAENIGVTDPFRCNLDDLVDMFVLGILAIFGDKHGAIHDGRRQPFDVC